MDKKVWRCGREAAHGPFVRAGAPGTAARARSSYRGGQRRVGDGGETIVKKVMHDVDEYLKGRLGELQQDLQNGLQAGMQGAFSSYELLRDNIVQLGIQQEGIAQEVLKTASRMEVIENVMTSTAMTGTSCPCISGRCPCKCNTSEPAAGGAVWP